MSAQHATCQQCAAQVTSTERFCEHCGQPLVATQRISVPRPALEGACTDCGNETYADGFCTACGNRRAEPDRDEAQLGEIALITDRGLQQSVNDDAAAAGAVTGSGLDWPYGIAVAVCDGVSSSVDARRAAAAASKAGVDAMLKALADSRTPRAAVLAGLGVAAEAAATAGPDPDPATGPSCTYIAATIVPNPTGTVQITVGNVGDSRAYWLPHAREEPRQLTVDDSVAQELISAGAAADSQAVLQGAHTLTRWLGAYAEPKPWSASSVHTITTSGPGSLLLCTDGLWNYLPDAADIADICPDADSTTAARTLIDYALSAGGHDNVTIVVVPIGGTHEFD